jgi:hypothetical protein
MHLSKLEKWFSIELAIDVPGQAKVDAISYAFNRLAVSGIDPLTAPTGVVVESLRCDVEDHLGYAGHPLSSFLNASSESDWKIIVGRAFAKAKARDLVQIAN